MRELTIDELAAGFLTLGKALSECDRRHPEIAKELRERASRPWWRAEREKE